jgi:3-oxoacyl-[acyl-carrier-protein] synthase-3
MRAAVLGTGSSLPERLLTNAELERMVETSDEWITARTGIRTRRIAGPDEQNYQLASRAARQALDAAGVTAAEIGLIIVATISPHTLMPSCACFVQTELGAAKAFAFDLNAACSGFLYALDVARKYIAADPDLKALLIGSETLSARVDWEDRNTCILFGDGAGACVLGSAQGRGIIDSCLFSDGSLWNLLYMDSPASTNPDLFDPESKGCVIQMSGRDVFKYAVRAMENAVQELLKRQQLAVSDIDLIIPHQANIRILDNLAERLGAQPGQVFCNVDKYGNTSAASIPIALDEAVRAGRLRRGGKLLLCAFGGGFTWGSMLMDW